VSRLFTLERVFRNDGVGSSNLSCGTTYLVDLTIVIPVDDLLSSLANPAADP